MAAISVPIVVFPALISCSVVMEFEEAGCSRSGGAPSSSSSSSSGSPSSTPYSPSGSSLTCDLELEPPPRKKIRTTKLPAAVASLPPGPSSRRPPMGRKSLDQTSIPLPSIRRRKQSLAARKRSFPADEPEPAGPREEGSGSRDAGLPVDVEMEPEQGPSRGAEMEARAEGVEAVQVGAVEEEEGTRSAGRPNLSEPYRSYMTSVL
ncbi:unnamed protein product [Heligmosomoides polygyrus]|uniref:Uncharacterized protein n=1 Tax=Heligmosomoides polygyrus TaxID=6339 RepID=A0A183GNW5_HELPZ|nr:unnamed protein product [Heligmosomoides polygyrus]